MNYKTMLKGALALSLSLIVGEASAYTATTNSVPAYGEDFEAKTVDAAISTYSALDAGDNNAPYGWLAPEGDESKIIAGGPSPSTKALQLNTDAGTLTNQFQKSVRDSLNAGIAAAGAYFETDVKFVPSDTLDAGIAGGTDATKFAIYAYANEDATPPTTNLVVYHKYYDAYDMPQYTNEQFGAVNCDAYTKLRVEMKQIRDGGTLVNAFSVKVNDGAALTSSLAIDGIWFLTAENDEVAANKLVSSLNFKGTGEIDNIAAGTISIAESYTVNFMNGETLIYSTNYAAGATAEYIGETPTQASTAASNFTFAAWSPALGTVNADTNYVATFTATVRSYTISWDVDGVIDTTTVAYGEVPTHAAPEKEGYTFTGWTPERSAVTGEATYVATFEEQQQDEGYKANDPVAGVTLTQAQADWLNTLRGQTSTADYTASITTAGTDLGECYLLNCDPTVAGNGGTLSITAITVGNEVSVTVALDRTGELGAIKGTLKLLGGSDLSGFGTTSVVDLSAVTFTTDGTYTASFSAGQNKFFKAVIE